MLMATGTTVLHHICGLLKPLFTNRAAIINYDVIPVMIVTQSLYHSQYFRIHSNV